MNTTRTISILSVLLVLAVASRGAAQGWPRSAPPVPSSPTTKEISGVMQPPSVTEGKAWIDVYCAWEWPERNLSNMRQRCLEQQTETLVALNDRTVGSEKARGIRNACAKEWPLSFTMRDHCERMQLGPAASHAASLPPSPGADDVPTSSAAAGGIRSKCAKDWATDFAMRKACEDQQNAALTTLRGRPMTASADHRTIRTKCSKDWPDDFMMRNACEEQQLKALAAIR